MNIKWMMSAIAVLACTVFVGVGQSADAEDTCGGCFGDIAVPTGNIAQSGGTWYTPIGGDSGWTAINYGDKDCPAGGGPCVDDSIRQKKWIGWNFAPSRSYGTSTSVTADDDPNSGFMALSLDDTGTPVEDGTHKQVASVSVEIVIPDSETSTIDSSPGCTSPEPYGCNEMYKGTVSKSGVTLDFDHCEVCELSCSALNPNGCNFTTGTPDNCATKLSISSNTWKWDNVAVCSATNTDYGPGGCISQNNCTWRIRVASGPGSWHTYGTPQYTFSTTRYMANLTCDRASF